MGHVTVRRLAASGLLAVALSALTACGGGTDEAQDPGQTASSNPDESASPSESDASDVPAGAPACGDVWVDGSRIARTYKGCVDDVGAYVERDAVGCSSGQRLVVFDGRFWGVLGGTVHEAGSSLDEDRDYRDATRRCAA